MNTSEAFSVCEQSAIAKFICNGQLSRRHLPENAVIGLDSMGPMRDSKTDRLFHQAEDALGRFGEVLQPSYMMLIVATNGPDVEGEEILSALPFPTTAFAVTEGGGKLITRDPSTGEFIRTVLASEDDLRKQTDIEVYSRQFPLMNALLSDTKSGDAQPPIRTPYDTNIVLTLPSDYETLLARLRNYGIALEETLGDVDASTFVERILSFSRDTFTDAITATQSNTNTSLVVKSQNRRVYVTPKHMREPSIPLSKYSGARMGSQILFNDDRYGYPEYTMANSIYVADKAVDKTSEGQLVLGESERSMIAGELLFVGPDEENEITIIRKISSRRGEDIYYAEVEARMAINVTMNEAMPKMYSVGGIPILDIGSGAKALDAIGLLYASLHG